ncbi:MAG TPA: hypothetical protein VFA53_08675 [Xanthobacteraceae bacterium]|nr:hypothetical protein [Xanthobacteraceae bacterium]
MRPSLVSDDMHAWIGAEAVGSVGIPASRYPLTDDERELRDLAYPLIEPPFSRQRWDNIIGEYGLNRILTSPWSHSDPSLYGAELMARPFRSATARYQRLIEDVRNDVVRIEPFARIAARVADMDDKRQRSLGYIHDLDADERANAERRIAENRLIVRWVFHSLNDRAEGYHFALERLVAADPSPLAADAERVWNLLKMRIGRAAPRAEKIAARG